MKVKKDKFVKKHHVWGGIGIIIGIVITIVVIGIFSYKYVHYVEQEGYVKGGEDMARLIYDNVAEYGGASIEVGGEKIIVAKYEKPIGGIE